MKSPKTFSKTIKIPTIFSDTTKIQKKKRVTFKNSFIRCQRNTHDQVGTQTTGKPITINVPNQGIERYEQKKALTCIPFNSLTDLYMNKQPQQKRLPQSYLKIEDSLNLNSHQLNRRNQLLLTMFKQNVTPTIDSTNYIAFDESRYSSYGKIIVSKKIIKGPLQDESPFQEVEREIQKKKSAFRKKSLTGLEKLSKKLLNDLNAHQKFDENTNIIRQRYLSYFHSRIQKKPFRDFTSNRQSLQNSHQHARSKSIDCQMGLKLFSPSMRKCVDSCISLIGNCKKVQREQRLRKEVKFFTIYSKDFAKKCQKKFNFIDRIKKTL